MLAKESELRLEVEEDDTVEIMVDNSIVLTLLSMKIVFTSCHAYCSIHYFVVESALFVS